MKDRKIVMNNLTKIIRKYIVMLLALYIGFLVMTGFMGIDKPDAALFIAMGIALVMIVLLLWCVYQIKKLKTGNTIKGDGHYSA